MELKTAHYTGLLRKFDTHIESTKSLNSGNSYTNHAKHFLLYLEDRQIFSLKYADGALMKEYFEFLITRPKIRGEGILSIRSVNDNLSSLRMFSIRMQQEDIIRDGLPIPLNIRIDRDSDNVFALVREVVTQEEIRKIYSVCETNLERALIALAYGSGLRRSSLANLQETHIDFRTGQVTVLKGKNNKTLQVPVSEFFLKVLKDYSLERLQLLSSLELRQRRFFINERGTAISGEKLNDRLKVIIARTKDAELIDKGITLHCLRHSIATHLMDDGQSFDYVRQFLGHTVADTTVIYARRRKIKTYYEI